MRPQCSTAQEVIRRIAVRQHGVAARQQLLRAGLSRDEVRRRVRAGLLIRVFPGVYRVGHRAPSVLAHYMAAVLACGEGARLAEDAAAFLLDLRRRPPPRPVVSTLTYRRIEGIETRRRRNGDDVDTVTVSGVPATSPARTLVDLAASLREPELARACHEAQIKHGVTPEQIEAVLARRRNTSGADSLRRILRGETRVTLSRLEAKFLVRLKQRGLPLPQTNSVAGSHYVDCRWPDQRVTVELDGFRFHNTRHSWEQDRHREREARARGDEFRRYTWLDVDEAPEPMLDDLQSILPPPLRNLSCSPR